MSKSKAQSDACLRSYMFSLSNQHIFRGGGDYILVCVSEKRQESEMHYSEIH